MQLGFNNLPGLIENMLSFSDANALMRPCTRPVLLHRTMIPTNFLTSSIVLHPRFIEDGFKCEVTMEHW